MNSAVFESSPQPESKDSISLSKRQQLSFLMHEVEGQGTILALTLGQFSKESLLWQLSGAIRDSIVNILSHGATEICQGRSENFTALSRRLLNHVIDHVEELLEEAKKDPASLRLASSKLSAGIPTYIKLFKAALSVGNTFSFRGTPETLEVDDFLSVTSSAIEDGLGFKVELNCNIPDQVFIDKMLFFSLLFNLAKNAKEARKPLDEKIKPVLSISAQTNNSEIDITIKDFGKGISPEIRPRLFQFGASTKTSAYEERGHGLAFVKNVVEFAGGRVSVSSLHESEETASERSFTEFKISLPVLKTDRDVRNQSWASDLSFPEK